MGIPEAMVCRIFDVYVVFGVPFLHAVMVQRVQTRQIHEVQTMPESATSQDAWILSLSL